MNTDDILRAAIECQLITTGNRDGLYADALVRFANLVRTKLLAEQPAEQKPGDARYALAMLVDPEKLEPWQLELYDKAMTAPQPTKQPLTVQQITEIERYGEFWETGTPLEFARAIERAHGIGGQV